jgi:hypothetical protein
MPLNNALLWVFKVMVATNYGKKLLPENLDTNDSEQIY